jgi:hypothetical protein
MTTPTDWRETLSFLDHPSQGLSIGLADYDLTVRLLLAMLAQANMSDAPDYRQPWQLHNDASGGPVGRDDCGVYGAIQYVISLLGADAAHDEASENGEVSTKPGELEARFCPRNRN